MSELTIFGKPNNAALALLGGIEDNLTSTLAGNTGSGNRRISIEGGAFREFIGGKEVRVSEDRAMNVVLVNALTLLSHKISAKRHSARTAHNTLRVLPQAVKAVHADSNSVLL